MADKPIDAMRIEYRADSLDAESIREDPITQFREWFAEARTADTREANAMTLATANAAGEPSARIVLLKDIRDSGFVFYTNKSSRKGIELAENQACALVFWWPPLERQVRIEGNVRHVADDVADAYFSSRPRKSQLGAAASDQSTVLPDRAALEQRFAELDAKYADQPIPRPKEWGGYEVVPRRIEFWQGRESRMHDRIRFTRDGDGWKIERLAP